MHDRRIGLETFNPDVLDVVQAARQQRAETLRSLLRSPVQRERQNEHVTAFSRLWSILMRDARAYVRRTR